MTTVERISVEDTSVADVTEGEDRGQDRVHGLLGMLRDAEADCRRSYSRVLGVVAELARENAGALTGFGSTARLVAGVKV
ncbi:MAG: hypothetical protein WCF33_23425 [Pseudonocardiaceae bacterium]